jgi:hypothetical protein
VRPELRCAALALLLLAACGKEGPPLPPIRISPPPPGNFTVRQTGASVVVAADLLPGVGVEGQQPVVEAQILRMPASSGLRPGAVSNRYLLQQFLRQSEQVVGLAGDDLRRAVSGRRLVYHDDDPVVRSTAGATFMYSMVLIGADGERSSLPLPELIELVDPPPPPADLQVEVAEGEVRLQWVSGTGEEAQYNVYRGPAGAPRPPEEPLNQSPLSEPYYVDTALRYGEHYRYTVRVVAVPGHPLRESADGEAREVLPLDIFPPAAPTGLAVALEGEVLRLYWFPNDEPDLAGYRIYRREESEAGGKREGEPPPPLGEPPQLIGEVPLSETIYTDTTAVPGVRYHYAVTAIDNATPPNESPRSEGRSETLLPAEPPPADDNPGGEGSA